MTEWANDSFEMCSLTLSCNKWDKHGEMSTRVAQNFKQFVCSQCKLMVAFFSFFFVLHDVQCRATLLKIHTQKAAFTQI